MKTTEKRFGYFCIYAGAIAGLLTFGCIIIDGHSPPVHPWFGLFAGIFVGWGVYAAGAGLGRMILFEPPKLQATRPARSRSRYEKKFLDERRIQNR